MPSRQGRPRADAFADLVTQNLNCPRPDGHDPYVDMIANPAVDVVYVATPHPQHRPIALAAIEAGKTFSVENSFTATSLATTEIAEDARAKRSLQWKRGGPAPYPPSPR
ncbi:oxidoreductase, NAD-binding domain protein [Cutibacterium modestum 31N]|nr:oxidoreductase, NAD-binding domain protein [Cutibacterium modestum 31N]